MISIDNYDGNTFGSVSIVFFFEKDEEPEEDDADVEGPKYEEDCLDPWETLVFSSRRVAVENRAKNGVVIVISDSSMANEANEKKREEGVGASDMSEEGINHSGRLDRICRDCYEAVGISKGFLRL